MDQHDPSSARKNFQNMESSGQVIHQVLRFTAQQTKTHRLNWRSAYPKLGAKKPAQSVHSNQPRTNHPSNQTHVKQLLKLIVCKSYFLL